MPDQCEHFSTIQTVAPGANGCEECLAIGSKWIALRLCLTCGHVGCCEDSEHAHALQHFNKTGHMMLASFEPDETWAWCYIHRRYFDPAPGRIPKRRSGLGALLAKLVGR